MCHPRIHTCHLHLFVITHLKVKITQSCPTLYNPWNSNYTVHGILQARILEWVAILFSRASSQPRDQTQVSHIAGRFFTSWATRGQSGIQLSVAPMTHMASLHWMATTLPPSASFQTVILHSFNHSTTHSQMHFECPPCATHCSKHLRPSLVKTGDFVLVRRDKQTIYIVPYFRRWWVLLKKKWTRKRVKNNTSSVVSDTLWPHGL